jgi:sugar phosphate isomerase/epimerase
MMKLGLVSAILPELSFEELFDYSAGLGFEGIEVCCWPKGKAERRYAGITHIDLDTLTPEKEKHYLDYAKKYGIGISSLGYYPNALSVDKAEAEVAVAHIKELIEASARMDIGMVTTFIGRDQKETVEANLDKMEKVWGPIIKLAEEKNVLIAIENCPMLFTKDEWPGGKNLMAAPYLWRNVFERLPSKNLGLNYDPSHLMLTGSDHVLPVYDFAEKIFHVHFKDIRIYQDKLNEYGRFAYPSLWHSPKIPGLGQIDFAALISALNDIRFDGYACIEIEDKTFEGSAEEVRSAIKQSYEFLRQYM